jgi:hypothetical protein
MEPEENVIFHYVQAAERILTVYAVRGKRLQFKGDFLL